MRNSLPFASCNYRGSFLLSKGVDLFSLYIPENFNSWTNFKTFLKEILNYWGVSSYNAQIHTLEKIAEQPHISSPKQHLNFDRKALLDASIKYEKKTSITETLTETAESSKKNWLRFYNITSFVVSGATVALAVYYISKIVSSN